MIFYENATGNLWQPGGLIATVAKSPQGGVGTTTSWPLVRATWPTEHVLQAFGLTVEAWPPVPDGHVVTSRVTTPGNPVVFTQTTAVAEPQPLTRQQFKLFLELSGLKADAEAALPGLHANPDRKAKLAAYTVEEAQTFRFRETVALTRALTKIPVTEDGVRPLWEEIAALHLTAP